MDERWGEREQRSCGSRRKGRKADFARSSRLEVLAPPAPAAADEHQDAKQDHEAGPEHIALQPREPAKVLQEVVETDQNQGCSPAPRPPHGHAPPPTPPPRTQPAPSPFVPHGVPLLLPPTPPFIACSSRAWRL